MQEFHSDHIEEIQMGFEIKGLKELQQKMEALAEVKSVPVPELLTPEFVSACSKYASAQELFDASGLEIGTAEKFEEHRSELDEFLGKNTTYGNWSEMIGAAGEQYLKAKLAS
jgi:hypothetical protein